jgi:hypothetical protein
LFGAGERRQQQRRENRDDRDDHQQFDQREAASAVRIGRCRNGSLLQDAIEAIREIRRLGIEQIERLVNAGVGADRRPGRKIGRRLQHIIAAGHADEAELELLVRQKTADVKYSGCTRNSALAATLLLKLVSNALRRNGRVGEQIERAGIRNELVVGSEPSSV